MKKVITISREFGSGGREIGFCLAEKLGIPFYDKEITFFINHASSFCEVRTHLRADCFVYARTHKTMNMCQ